MGFCRRVLQRRDFHAENSFPSCLGFLNKKYFNSYRSFLCICRFIGKADESVKVAEKIPKLI